MQSTPFIIPRYSFPTMLTPPSPPSKSPKRARTSSFSTNTGVAPVNLKIEVADTMTATTSEPPIEDGQPCGQAGCNKTFSPHLSAHHPNIASSDHSLPLTPPATPSSSTSSFFGLAKGKKYAMDQQANGREFERQWVGRMGGAVEGRTMSDGLPKTTAQDMFTGYTPLPLRVPGSVRKPVFHKSPPTSSTTFENINVPSSSDVIAAAKDEAGHWSLLGPRRGFLPMKQQRIRESDAERELKGMLAVTVVEVSEEEERELEEENDTISGTMIIKPGPSDFKPKPNLGLGLPLDVQLHHPSPIAINKPNSAPRRKSLFPEWISDFGAGPVPVGNGSEIVKAPVLDMGMGLQITEQMAAMEDLSKGDNYGLMSPKLGSKPTWGDVDSLFAGFRPKFRSTSKKIELPPSPPKSPEQKPSPPSRLINSPLRKVTILTHKPYYTNPTNQSTYVHPASYPAAAQTFGPLVLNERQLRRGGRKYKKRRRAVSVFGEDDLLRQAVMAEAQKAMKRDLRREMEAEEEEYREI